MMTSNNKKTIIFLLLVVCAVYANSLVSGFVWDDNWLIISKQAFFSHPENAIKILFSSDAPLGGEFPYYRPFNTLTYMLDHYLWGLHPFWYHLENIALHALAVVLFYLLLKKVFADGRLAFLAAVFFAVHPVNAEAVDLVSSRNTLFCAVFSIVALLFLAKGGTKWVIMSFFAYFLALLSKEPAVVIPFFLLSLRLTSKEEKFKAKWNILAGFFGITAVYFIMRHFILGAFIEKNGITFSTDRFKLVTSTVFEHFRLMLFPFRLNALYLKKAIPFRPYKAVAVIAGISLLLYVAVKKGSPAPVRAGVQWILWGMLPVSGIVKIPSAPIAERFQYTFLFGLAIVFGYLFGKMQKKKALAGTALASAFVLALGVRTIKRNFVWRDDLNLYSSMVRSDPENTLALYDLGVAYGKAGNLASAAQKFRTAISIDPEDIKARVNLGVAYAKEGHLDEAIQAFKAAVATNPNYIETLIDLGVAYAKEGHFKEAEDKFNRVLELDPDNSPAFEYLGRIKTLKGTRD